MNVVACMALLTCCAVLVAQAARPEDPAWPYANQNVARTNYCPNSGLDFSSRHDDAGQPKLNSSDIYRTSLPLLKTPLVVGQKGLVYGLYQLSENETFIVSINQTGGEVDRMPCPNTPRGETWSLNMQIVDVRYGLVASTTSGYHCVVGTDENGALQFFWSAQPTPGQMIYSTWTSPDTGSIALLFNSSSSTTRLATIDLLTGYLSTAQFYHAIFVNTPPPRLPIAVMGFDNIHTPFFVMSWPTSNPGFTAIGADTGEISWQHNLTTRSTPVVDQSGQSVYVLASTPSPWGKNITDYWLLKYSTVFGEELWKAPLTSAINDIHFGTISFDEKHNRVVVSGFGGVSQFDGNTGDLLWWIHDEPDALPTQVFISDSGDYFYMNGTDTCVVRWDQGHCEVLNVNQTLWGRVGGMGNGNLYSTLDVEGTNFHHVVIAYSGSSTSDSTPWWKTTIGIGMLATIGGLLVLVLITLSIMAVVIFVKRSRKRSHGYSLLSPTN